jgi:hypothetical protein
MATHLRSSPANAFPDSDPAFLLFDYVSQFVVGADPMLDSDAFLDGNDPRLRYFGPDKLRGLLALEILRIGWICCSLTGSSVELAASTPISSY